MPSLTARAERAAGRLRALPPVVVDAVIVAVCLVNAMTQLAARHPSRLWLVDAPDEREETGKTPHPDPAGAVRPSGDRVAN